MSTGIDKLAKELKEMISASDNRKPSPYDTQAEVIRVEDGVAWVHIPGGVQETPVKLTVDAKKGDMVNVHVAGGSAWITGNSTSPPTDDTKANHAYVIAEVAENEAVNATNTAENAKKTATNYITSITGLDGITVHDTNDFSNYINITSGVINLVTEGISRFKTFIENNVAKLRIGNEVAGHIVIDEDDVSVMDGQDELATFGASGMRIGKIDEKHIQITNNDFNVFDDDGSLPFAISTAASSKTETCTRWSSVSESTGSYRQNTFTIFLRGTLTDGKAYFGISTSGKPTTFTDYISPTSSSQQITVNGINIVCYIAQNNILKVIFTNTTSTLTYIGVQYTETYRETSARVNDVYLMNKVGTPRIIDTKGTSSNRQICTYGKIAQFSFTVTNSSSIASAGIFYTGQLLDYPPRYPAAIIGRPVSSPKVVLLGSINGDGSIAINNTSGNALSGSVYFYSTYILA